MKRTRSMLVWMLGCAALDAEGQAIYDKVAGIDRTTPMIGPGGVSLHMPKAAAREFDQQYEWTFHETAALTEGAPQEVVDAIKFDRALDLFTQQGALEIAAIKGDYLLAAVLRLLAQAAR